jgi:hypothetical protein
VPSQRNSSSGGPKCSVLFTRFPSASNPLALNLSTSRNMSYAESLLKTEVCLFENEDILCSLLRRHPQCSSPTWAAKPNPITARLAPPCCGPFLVRNSPLSVTCTTPALAQEFRSELHHTNRAPIPPRILFSSPSFSHPSVHNSITFHLFPISIPISITTKLQLRSRDPNMSTRKRKQDEELVALPSDESEEEEE